MKDKTFPGIEFETKEKTTMNNMTGRHMHSEGYDQDNKKLVRNKIPELYDGKYYVADDEEYKQRLFDKMREELDEFIENPSIEEAADMLEVLWAIFSAHEMLKYDVVIAANAKVTSRGAFSKRFIWEKE